MDLGLSGKRAAVAAATSGLGLATAHALSAEGAEVFVCGRDGARLERALEMLGGPARGAVIDVGDAEGGRRFVATASEELGGLDILVTNAGGPPPGTFGSVRSADYGPALDLNLLSVVGMCEEAVPLMQQQRWGRVVAITSISVRQPIPNLILSNTARAGVTGFLKTLAREVAEDGVTVNSLQPGIHRTDRVAQVYGEDADPIALGVPTGEFGRPEDFGDIVTFVCSEQARFVTGAAIPVDGGSYAGLL